MIVEHVTKNDSCKCLLRQTCFYFKWHLAVNKLTEYMDTDATHPLMGTVKHELCSNKHELDLKANENLKEPV